MKIRMFVLLALAVAALLCRPGTAGAGNWYDWLTYYLGYSAPYQNYQPQGSYQTYTQWNGNPYGAQYGSNYQNSYPQYHVQYVPGYQQQGGGQYYAQYRVPQRQRPVQQRTYAAPVPRYYQSGTPQPQYGQTYQRRNAYARANNTNASWSATQPYGYSNQAYAAGNAANCLPGSS